MIDRGSLQPSRSATRHGRSIITGAMPKAEPDLGAAVHPKLRDQRARSDRRCPLSQPSRTSHRAGKARQCLDALTGQGRYDASRLPFGQRRRQPGLIVQVVEKNYAPPTVQPAVEVDGCAKRECGLHHGDAIHLHGRGRLPLGMGTDLLFGNT